MNEQSFTGIVLDDECTLTIEDLCYACHANTQWIIDLVDEGVIEPHGADVANWYFSGVSLQRARRAMRLHKDLGVNIAGIALALDLMDQIEELQSRLVDPNYR